MKTAIEMLLILIALGVSIGFGNQIYNATENTVLSTLTAFGLFLILIYLIANLTTKKK